MTTDERLHARAGFYRLGRYGEEEEEEKGEGNGRGGGEGRSRASREFGVADFKGL